METGHKLTNCDHEQLPRADHVYNTIGIFEDLQHHLLLVLGRWTVLGMRTGMDDTVHIQIEIVEFFAIWIGSCRVDGYRGSIVHLDGLILNHRRYNLGILVG